MQWKIVLKYFALVFITIVTTITAFALLEIVIEGLNYKVPNYLNTIEIIILCIATICCFVYLGYNVINKSYIISAVIGFIVWILLAIFIIHVLKREYMNYHTDFVCIMLIAIVGTAIGRIIHQQILYYKD